MVDRVALALGLVGLGFGVAGGPGWAAVAGESVIATGLDRTAQSPLYHLLASVAAALPIGEPGFRLGALSAVLGAIMLVGVLRAGRALLPADPVAGIAPALLLALAPPWREAAHLAGPAMLTGAGTVWALGLAAEHARGAPRRVLPTLALVAVVIGSAPWLGVGLGLLVGAWLARSAPRPLLAAGAGALGVVVVLLWADALGPLPSADANLSAAVVATARGAAAVVVGAGLLGAAFAMITGLPMAGWFAAALGLAAAHAVAIDPNPATLLGLLAVTSAVLPGAVVRAIGTRDAPSSRRHLIAAAAGAPLVLAGLLAGIATQPHDAGDSPTRLATDLVGTAPPGPGTIVATRVVPWAALQHEQAVAGARPDLALTLPGASDATVVRALRMQWLAVSDAFAFGILDPQRTLPRGRGFQMQLDEVTVNVAASPPARYATATGAIEAIQLAVTRARFEAGNGQLEQAARAAGLAGTRFSGSDLAILATTVPSPERPAFFGFVPAFGQPPGPWQLELVGDDLAWVSGLDVPPATSPAPRVLHARWVALWGTPQLSPIEPSIVALGPAAVTATQALLAALRPATPPSRTP